MFAIAFAYSEESKAKLKALGYHEQMVMVKHASDKKSGEAELYQCRPFQFAVTDYWGACPD